MDFLVIVLRLVHIMGGIIWVGAALTLNYFIGPSVAATDVAGQQFMRHLMLRTRFSNVMAVSAILTVLAGAILYGRDASAGPAWQSSGPGIGYGIGAVFGVVGLIFGMLIGITSGALARLGEQIQGKPTSEQAAKLDALRKRLNTLGPLNVYSLLIAAALMAVARYLVF
jgi:uncharacterized membrane protein